jgi:phospholipase D1/2
MNGESYPCGIFAGSLRKRLFREHLGLLDAKPHQQRMDINDPIISSFWHGQWLKISHRNTELYDEIFRCIPTDQVTTLAQMKRYSEENPPLCRSDPEAAELKVKGIQGFLVDLPLKFLEGENLIPSGTSKEGIMPTSLWI